MLEIEFLGTGTSTGVPEIQCHCPVCTSTDPRDKRLRCSAIVRYQGKNILIDCGPDFRTQILRATSPTLDALLLTHIHYDHVGGLDDLRAYCRHGRMFPIYARHDVINDIHYRLPYCFKEHLYPGVPTFEIHEIGDEPFLVDGVRVEPIPVNHYKLLINGYRIGPLAYITDAKYISQQQIDRLHHVPLLVINALRFKEHISHMTLAESLDVISQIQPQSAYLIHMSHDMGLHSETSKLLPPNVHFAYDGLIVRTNDE